MFTEPFEMQLFLHLSSASNGPNKGNVPTKGYNLALLTLIPIYKQKLTLSEFAASSVPQKLYELVLKICKALKCLGLHYSRVPIITVGAMIKVFWGPRGSQKSI